MIIRPSLMRLGMWSEDAEELLLGTAIQESKGGTYFKQLDGPALGIFQIEQATHKDIWDSYLDYNLDIARKVSPIGMKDKANLVTDLKYATMIARLVYSRRPEPLPKATDLEGLAAYWKTYYNTKLGKGTEEEFIFNYNKALGK